MTALAQELFTWAAVAAAAGWLVAATWRRRSEGRCDGCSPRSIPARTRGPGVRSKRLRVLP